MRCGLNAPICSGQVWGVAKPKPVPDTARFLRSILIGNLNFSNYTIVKSALSTTKRGLPRTPIRRLARAGQDRPQLRLLDVETQKGPSWPKCLCAGPISLAIETTSTL